MKGGQKNTFWGGAKNDLEVCVLFGSNKRGTWGGKYYCSIADQLYKRHHLFLAVFISRLRDPIARSKRTCRVPFDNHDHDRSPPQKKKMLYSTTYRSSLRRYPCKKLKRRIKTERRTHQTKSTGTNINFLSGQKPKAHHNLP